LDPQVCTINAIALNVYDDSALVGACALVLVYVHEPVVDHAGVTDMTFHDEDVTNVLLPKFQDKQSVQPSIPNSQQSVWHQLLY
jgi:hypothetical protein